MKIAVQVADLDHSRIDGTRVYIANVLKNFGTLDRKDDFYLFHRGKFNPELEPPHLPNFYLFKIPFPFLWTQIAFAYYLWKSRADVVWMPMAALPFWRRKKMKTVVTIHDLAFKHFPKTFAKNDLRKLNFFADYSIAEADKIIAVSEATKKDILHFYPKVKEEKIKVIYHGFSADIFSETHDKKQEEILKERLNIVGEYVLYAGALQPRKNIKRLIEAFDLYKNKTQSPLKLVLAGEKAWLAKDIEEAAQKSFFAKDIIFTGRIRFCDMGNLFRGASIFIYPSLYEGFGIPILESFAAGVPVITANNSSLPEVAGEAAAYFEAGDVQALANQIEIVLSSSQLREKMIFQGRERLKYFSWKKCAQETLEFIKS